MRTRCYLLALLAALLTVQAVASAAPRSLPERPMVPRADGAVPDCVEVPDQVLNEPRSEAEPTVTELPEEQAEPAPSDASEPAEPPLETDAETPNQASAAEARPDPMAEASVPTPADDATSGAEAGTSDLPTAEPERETDSAAPMASEPLEASPMLDGTLAIAVASHVTFGTAEIGASTDAVPFDMTIQNLSEQGWQVTVEGSELVGGDPTTPPIGRTSLYLTGGMGPFPAGVITSHAGYLSTSEPLVLLRGTGEARGEFALTQATILLEVPADAIPDTYRATLTYTIMALEP